MATFSVDGVFDFDELLNAGAVPSEVMNQMLHSSADVIVKNQKQAAETMLKGKYATGRLAKSIGVDNVMGTVADKLSKLLSTKADIRAAITEKGQAVADSDTFASYADKIRAIETSAAPGTPLDPVEVYNSTRPADWLQMPAPADNEMYLLFHIPDGVSSLLAFTVTCTGNYTVALGTVTDGAFVQQSAQTVASNAKYETELFADNYGNITSNGMKQVMVKVSGVDILTWNPSPHSKKTAPSGFCGWNIVEIVCKLPSGKKVACGSSTSNASLRQLRYFSWIGTNSVTNMSSMFSNCNSLTAVPQMDTGSVTNMSYMFNGCNSLTAITLDPSVTGWAEQPISLSNCSLGHTAIVQLFNSLPTITASNTLTLTGNPGVPELTDEEKAIATGKNWTLTL